MPARRLTVEILGEARQLNRTLGQVDTRLGRFGKNTERVGRGVAAIGAGFVASRIVRGLNQATQAASDLNETQNKTQVVFGKAAGIVLKFGETSAKSVGLSTQAAEEAAATFGNLFVAMKIGQKPAADMSVGLVKLAGDLASFNNADPTEVLENLRSGLTGEVEPLRKYGIALNVASVEQEAMRETGKANVKQLTEADKVTARYRLILKNTTTAQGDFARTSTGLANQQRILNAQWKDAQAQFGKALLPAMQQGVRAASALAGGFTKLDAATGGLATKGLLAAAGLGAVGFAVGKTLKFVNESKTAWKALRAAKIANVVTDKVVGDAELALAAKTKIAGDAAATSAGKFKTLGGLAGVGLAGGIVLGAAAIGLALKKLDDQLSKSDLKKKISELGGDPAALSAARSRLGDVNDQLAKMADGTLPRTFRAQSALREEQRRLTEAVAGFRSEGIKTTDRVNLLGSQLDRTGGTLATFTGKVQAATASYRSQVNANKTLHDQLVVTRDSILGQADAFEHGRRASGVSAKGIIGDLNREVETLKTWAGDAQRLIKRGMNPEAVKFLSDKGPEYLHAFATGSDKQVGKFEKLFKDRMVRSGEVAFNTTLGAAEDFRRMAERANAATAKIKAAKARVDGAAQATREMRRFRDQSNAAINGIHGTNVNVIAHAKIDRRELRSGLAAIASGNPRAMATGGKVPGTGDADNTLIYATPGEAVVPKRLVPAIAPWLREHGVPGFAAGGVVPRGVGRVGTLRPDMQGEVNRVSAALAVGTLRAATTGVAKFLKALEALGGVTGAGSAAIKRFIRSTDSHPYVWGGAGPGGYDCSGLTGAVYGKMRGRGGGSGQRYFTTASNFGRLGFKPGVGGTYAIGVLPGVHMAGNYGGLRFEARSTRSGIKTGGAARSVGSFPVRYHMASGGLVRSVNRLAGIPGVDIGGDEAGLRFAAGRLPVFDSGGRLRPGINVVENRTGRPEDLVPAGRGQPIVVQVNLDGRRVAEQVTYWQRKAAR